MSILSFLGLCEHKWKRTGKVIRHSVGLAQGYGQAITTGYTEICECSRCGAIKGFRI